MTDVVESWPREPRIRARLPTENADGVMRLQGRQVGFATTEMPSRPANQPHPTSRPCATAWSVPSAASSIAVWRPAANCNLRSSAGRLSLVARILAWLTEWPGCVIGGRASLPAQRQVRHAARSAQNARAESRAEAPTCAWPRFPLSVSESGVFFIADRPARGLFPDQQ
jgi:hypothetical protein